MLMGVALKNAALLAPLGISPLFALAAFGAADSFGLWEAPIGLEPLTYPVVWISLLLLGLMIQFGRSSKITKPFAEALGTGESVLAICSLVLLMIPHFTDTQPAVEQAGLSGALLLFTATTTALVVLIVMRTALDVLIWLSPIPFIDFIFQAVKVALTLGLVALAIVYPEIALAVNLLLVVVALVSIRWAIRTARSGLTMAYDLITGRWFRKATAR